MSLLPAQGHKGLLEVYHLHRHVPALIHLLAGPEKHGDAFAAAQGLRMVDLQAGYGGVYLLRFAADIADPLQQFLDRKSVV